MLTRAANQTVQSDLVNRFIRFTKKNRFERMICCSFELKGVSHIFFWMSDEWVLSLGAEETSLWL